MQVVARSLRNLQVEITAGSHRFIADEPLEAGEDMGPNPYDLLLAALGACKVMTVHMYAGRKEWQVDKVTVRLTTRRVYVEDCERCESDPNARVDIIECDISFEGDLDDEQIQRLVEISERCPVHRTLTSDTHIYTHLVEDADMLPGAAGS
jgi:putative redox protein